MIVEQSHVNMCLHLSRRLPARCCMHITYTHSAAYKLLHVNNPKPAAARSVQLLLHRQRIQASLPHEPCIMQHAHPQQKNICSAVKCRRFCKPRANHTAHSSSAAWRCMQIAQHAAAPNSLIPAAAHACSRTKAAGQPPWMQCSLSGKCWQALHQLPSARKTSQLPTASSRRHRSAGRAGTLHAHCATCCSAQQTTPQLLTGPQVAPARRTRAPPRPAS